MNHTVYLTITADQKPEVLGLVRRLPSILSGRVPDEHGIAQGFRTRIGYALLSLIAPNFNELGRGIAGADGDKWAPLTREYLAYGRRFGPQEEAQLKVHAGVKGSKYRHAPGNNKGLLTKEQLLLWRRTYADRLAWYIMRESDASAKAHAAAVAWIVVKAKGARTKLEVFGNRQVQILVDTGYLRGSLQPGTLHENGVEADYTKPGTKGGMQQVAEFGVPYAVIVGTNTQYAKYHHTGKGRRKRRLWPQNFPTDWWDQILNATLSGLSRVGELFR